jgi:hypothetical protein
MIWQTIETAPKDGTKIDLYVPRLGRIQDCFWWKYTYGEGWYYPSMVYRHPRYAKLHEDPTFWIILPPVPKES